MITLKTLHEATAQQVFDQAANHLIAQNRRSYDQGACLYRLGNLKCAAGCFISDDEYRKQMDINNSSAWSDLVFMGLVPNTVHNDLINQLQHIHDDSLPVYWKDCLVELAKEHGLSTSF